jgi:hypothetical protein
MTISNSTGRRIKENTISTLEAYLSAALILTNVLITIHWVTIGVAWIAWHYFDVGLEASWYLTSRGFPPKE